MKLTLNCLNQIARILFIVMVIFQLSACGNPPEPEIEEPAKQVKMMTVGDYLGRVSWEYPGVITATLDVDLSFGVGGEILEIHIEDGQHVSQGDVLARLDPVDYLAARDAAEANRIAMRSAYVRAVNIFKEGAGSQAEVDKTRRDIKVAEQELTRAQKALDDVELKAPYDGVVARKIAEVNQNVLAKEAVLTFQDTSSLEIDVAVPERDFVRMKPGLSLEERTARARPEIMVSSLQGLKIPGWIKSFTTTADPVTRTYKATFAFENPEAVNILPGMTARVVLNPPLDIIGEEVSAEGLMVPVSATSADAEGNAYVWVIDPDSMKVSRTPVTLGDMTGPDVFITAGLKRGDRIAISGVAHLHEGVEVRPLEKY